MYRARYLDNTGVCNDARNHRLGASQKSFHSAVEKSRKDALPGSHSYTTVVLAGVRPRTLESEAHLLRHPHTRHYRSRARGVNTHLGDLGVDPSRATPAVIPRARHRQTRTRRCGCEASSVTMIHTFCLEMFWALARGHRPGVSEYFLLA